MRQNWFKQGITRWLMFLVALLVPSAGLGAQDLTTTANLVGTVADSTGAVVPNATVKITGTENGVVRTVQTNGSGGYIVNLLPPGTYNLSVTSAGFKSYEQNGITLSPGQGAKQDVGLAIGSEGEQVIVNSQAPLVDTGDANLSAEIDAKQVVALPLNLRNIISLATLNSSVQNTTQSESLNEGGSSGKADQDVSFLNFGGGFFGTTAYLLDGVWDTDSTWGAVIYVPSVEAVADFKIQTNQFTAQSGFSTGNVINVETKSGTRDFHGDLFEFLRNSKLDANNYFNNYNGAAKPNFHRNQFGASAGGPIYIPKLLEQRDKAFIFGTYEGLRESSPVNNTFTVPTVAEKSGNFADRLGPQLGVDALGLPVLTGEIYNPNTGRILTNGTLDTKTGRTIACPASGSIAHPATCFYRDPVANNNLASVPGLINPIGAALIKFYPSPTNSGITNNYFASAAAPVTSDEYLIRGDWNVSQSTRIYARFADKHEQKTNSPAYYDAGYGSSDPGGPGNVRPNDRYSVVAGISHIFNATTAATANVGFHRWNQGGLSQAYPFDQTTIGLPASLNSNSNQFPLVTISNGGSSLGPQQGGFGSGFANVGSVSADLTKTLPKNDLSFGFMDVVLQNNGNGPAETSFNFANDYSSGLIDAQGTSQANTGNGFATLLLGYPDSGSTGLNFHTAPEEHYVGFYAQDNYKATRNLTLTLGTRYELQLPWTERFNRQAYFDYAATNPISSAVGINLPGEEVFSSPGNRHLFTPNLLNVAPRFGFTDQILPKLVLRGGYGLFFPPAAFVGIQASPGFNPSTPVVGSTTNGLQPGVSLSNPFPTGIRQSSGSSTGGLTDVGFSATTGVPHSRVSPFVQQYSVGLQYAFTANDVLTASYVGNHGDHLLTDNVSRSQINPALVVPGNNFSTQVANPFYGKITSSGCALASPTVPLGQLAQNYPEYCSVAESEAPQGDSYYNALLVDYNHRFHSGLNLLVSYTYSKFLDDTSGTADWAYVGNQSGYRNPYDIKLDKSLDGSDIKHSLVANYIYQLPVGRGQKYASHINRGVDAVIGGWQLSGIVSAKSGFPLAISGNTITPYYSNQHVNEVANPYLPGRNIHAWFNTAAFQNSAPFTFGNTTRYQADLRSPGYYNWDSALEKFWNLPNEKFRLQGRAEFYNLLNYANFYAPDTGIQDGSKYGTITQAFDARDVQFALKLLF